MSTAAAAAAAAAPTSSRLFLLSASVGLHCLTPLLADFDVQSLALTARCAVACFHLHEYDIKATLSVDQAPLACARRGEWCPLHAEWLNGKEAPPQQQQQRFPFGRVRSVFFPYGVTTEAQLARITPCAPAHTQRQQGATTGSGSTAVAGPAHLELVRHAAATSRVRRVSGLTLPDRPTDAYLRLLTSALAELRDALYVDGKLSPVWMRSLGRCLPHTLRVLWLADMHVAPTASLVSLELPSSLRVLSLPQRWSGAVETLPPLPASLEELRFGEFFDSDVRALELPPDLKMLWFGYHFNQTVGDGTLRLPPSLHTLVMQGRRLDIDALPLPPMLTQLRVESMEKPLLHWSPPPLLRSFCTSGNHAELKLPPNLTHLQLPSFNQGSLLSILPRTLTHLDLGRFFEYDLPSLAALTCLHSLRLNLYDRPFAARAPFPPSLRRLLLRSFNQPLRLGSAESACPPLDQLRLGDLSPYTHALTEESLPSHLRELILWKPRQLPTPPVLPAHLHSLLLGDVDVSFVSSVRLPDSLQCLRLFGNCPSDMLEQWSLPAGLQELCVGPWHDGESLFNSVAPGSGFNGALPRVRSWPSDLRTLRLLGDFNQPLSGACLPSTLRTFHLGHAFDSDVSSLQLPEELDELTFGAFHPQFLKISSNMQHALDTCRLPPKLRHITLPEVCAEWPQSFPPSLRWVDIARRSGVGVAIRWTPQLAHMCRQLHLPPLAVRHYEVDSVQ